MIHRRERIILIGLMGAGKSTVGRVLADAIKTRFIDVDDVAVETAGRSIPEIFETDGEEGFRAIEKSALMRALASDAGVIACGGGAILDGSNVDAMRSQGKVVYLHVDPAIVAERLGSGEGRPLIWGLDVASRLEKTFEERDGIYRDAAHLVVDASGDVGVIVDEVIAKTA
ncbi:MAG: shikimate kinase [Actinomycetota bacterium]|nr:shikimate kinase [Actinomycetota bacterium]